MAKVVRLVHASPSRVFEVLANGWYYSNWVVGTSHMRAEWPAAGSRLHHASGAWPFVARDESVVEEVEPTARLSCSPADGRSVRPE